MKYTNECFYDLSTALRGCIDCDVAPYLDIYNQLSSLAAYFENCIFSDANLEEGKTYILPLDVEMDLFDKEDYEIYTNPNEEEYDPDLASFVESHTKHINDEFVGVTLKAGTQLTYNNSDPYSGMLFTVDGYDIEWYGALIGKDKYGNEGVVPFVIKA